MVGLVPFLLIILLQPSRVGTNSSDNRIGNGDIHHILNHQAFAYYICHLFTRSSLSFRIAFFAAIHTIASP